MEENKSSIGGIIATIIIIAIIILGGLYFWGKRIEEKKSKQDLITNFSGPGQENNTNSVDVSDELDTIEAELNSNTVEGLDQELQ